MLPYVRAQFLRVDGISIKDLVINHPSKVDGAKSLAVTQYAVKGSEYECMAYLVSGTRLERLIPIFNYL